MHKTIKIRKQPKRIAKSKSIILIKSQYLIHSLKYLPEEISKKIEDNQALDFDGLDELISNESIEGHLEQNIMEMEAALVEQESRINELGMQIRNYSLTENNRILESEQFIREIKCHERERDGEDDLEYGLHSQHWAIRNDALMDFL